MVRSRLTARDCHGLPTFPAVEFSGRPFILALPSSALPSSIESLHRHSRPRLVASPGRIRPDRAPPHLRVSLANYLEANDRDRLSHPRAKARKRGCSGGPFSFGLLIFAYAMAYTARAIISAIRRWQAAQSRLIWRRPGERGRKRLSRHPVLLSLSHRGRGASDVAFSLPWEFHIARIPPEYTESTLHCFPCSLSTAYSH
jgi:hypothetical protein